MFRPARIAAIAALAHAGAAMAQATPAPGADALGNSTVFDTGIVSDTLLAPDAIFKDGKDSADTRTSAKPPAKPPACARPDFGEPGVPGTPVCPTPAPKPR